MMVVLFIRCGSDPRPTMNTFFDIEVYFQEEIAKLEADRPNINKITKFNDETEQIQTKDINWKQELHAFENSHINKPAWRDKYQIDSTFENGISILTYTALDQDLKTSNIEIRFDRNQKLTQLTIINGSDNFLYNDSEILTYFPDKSYSLVAEQSIFLLGKKHFEVTGEF
ncbi:MAG: hypothetical protein IH946_05115 [Bacteroidetes bacterium]|nr:hypothetical protein [Bacteroidota bacterium]